jgi:pimeloyl-ACP methyl ester carboxylesterase
VADLLKNNGHQVIAPDLPAHGADSTPLDAKPYELYVPRVCEIVDALDAPAVLVGHSSGGMIIDEVARYRRNKIQSLVFVSAFLLPFGKTPRDVMAVDKESILLESLEIDASRGSSFVKKDRARSVFYEDCSDEDAEWAIHQLQPEPLIPPGSSTVPALPHPSPSGVPRFISSACVIGH